MDKQPLSQLDAKIQMLIDNYKDLKKKYGELLDENAILKEQNTNNHQTISTLQSKLSELDNELTAKTRSLESVEQKCAEYEEKLSNMENVTKTASSKIDDILSQLNQL
jgi:chromosome segregation ATPase